MFFECLYKFGQFVLHLYRLNVTARPDRRFDTCDSEAGHDFGYLFIGQSDKVFREDADIEGCGGGGSSEKGTERESGKCGSAVLEKGAAAVHGRWCVFVVGGITGLGRYADG